MHNEISSIIDRLSSPSKEKRRADVDSESNEIAEPTAEVAIAIESNAEPTIPPSITIATVHRSMQPDEMHTDNSAPVVASTMEIDVEKYRQLIPYNTNDPEKMSQQESILELLISNGICDDETFKIFIAEPDSHKEKASQILDSLYCVNTLMPGEYENDGTIEWVDSIDAMQLTATDALPTNSDCVIETLLKSPIVIADAANPATTMADQADSSEYKPLVNSN